MKDDQNRSRMVDTSDAFFQYRYPIVLFY